MGTHVVRHCMPKDLPKSAGGSHQLGRDLQLDSCDRLAANDANSLQIVVWKFMARARSLFQDANGSVIANHIS